jgi:hypothetical protein
MSNVRADLEISIFDVNTEKIKSFRGDILAVRNCFSAMAA